MSELFKLHLFIYVDPETNLRIIYVCEDNSPALKEELERSCKAIFTELEKRKLLEAIEMCESDMFSRISKLDSCFKVKFRHGRGAERSD